MVGNCTLTSAAETAAGIVEINSLLHAELPATHILNLAVLPKGEVWPNRCSEAILAVNSELEVRDPFISLAGFRLKGYSICSGSQSTASVPFCCMIMQWSMLICLQSPDEACHFLVEGAAYCLWHVHDLLLGLIFLPYRS